jgi:hypothetical protein
MRPETDAGKYATGVILFAVNGPDRKHALRYRVTSNRNKSFVVTTPKRQCISVTLHQTTRDTENSIVCSTIGQLSPIVRTVFFHLLPLYLLLDSYFSSSPSKSSVRLETSPTHLSEITADSATFMKRGEKDEYFRPCFRAQNVSYKPHITCARIRPFFLNERYVMTNMSLGRMSKPESCTDVTSLPIHEYSS